MKRKMKLFDIAFLCFVLCGCNNQNKYNYSKYYEYSNYPGKGALNIFCWKEWFEWNTCLYPETSSGLYQKEWINDLQNNLPCPVDIMKDIIANDLKKNPEHLYTVCIVDKPVNDVGIKQPMKEIDSEKYYFLYDKLGLERKTVFYLK